MTTETTDTDRLTASRETDARVARAMGLVVLHDAFCSEPLTDYYYRNGDGAVCRLPRYSTDEGAAMRALKRFPAGQIGWGPTGVTAYILTPTGRDSTLFTADTLCLAVCGAILKAAQEPGDRQGGEKEKPDA